MQRDVCPEPASVQIQLALARAMSNIVSTGSGAPGFGRGHVSAAFASQSKSAAPTAVCSAWAGVVSGSRKARSRGRKGSFTFSEIARSGHSGTRRRSGAVAHRQAMPCIGAAGTVGRPEFAARAIPRYVRRAGPTVQRDSCHIGLRITTRDTTVCAICRFGRRRASGGNPQARSFHSGLTGALAESPLSTILKSGLTFS